MDAPKKHLQPFNCTLRATTGCSQFHLFTRLHKELRIHIWELALHRERFLHIRLDPKPDNGSSRHSGDDTCYTLTVSGRQIMSKLFRVSGESRDIAMQFYRLHIPCKYEWNEVRQDGILHLNPELDMLHVNPGRGDCRFADFLHDLITNDPLQVGLANLAMTSNDSYRLESIEVSRLSLARHMSLKRCLANLRQLWFLSMESAGRMFKGPRSGIPALTRFEMHRSRPILASIPTFERFPRDPRRISQDLQHVFVGTSDPRRMIYHSHKLLERLGLASQVNSGIQYRFMICCSNGGSGGLSRIVDQETAADWLQEEDQRWAGWKEKGIQRGHTVETPEQLEKAPQPAIGFWLFPIESLGKLPTHDVDDFRDSFWKGKRVLNMSRYPPELCLTVIP